MKCLWPSNVFGPVGFSPMISGDKWRAVVSYGDGRAVHTTDEYPTMEAAYEAAANWLTETRNNWAERQKQREIELGRYLRDLESGLYSRPARAGEG